MNDDLTLLASAYLDGDTTPAERAQVDGDPATLAEVERLRQVRAVLSQTDSAPISTRERHLAVAFEVWDRLPTSEFGGDATPRRRAARQPQLGRHRSRHRDRSASRVNAAAAVAFSPIAAGLVVVVGGGLVARGFISSNNNDTVTSEAADTADQDLGLRAELEVGSGRRDL